MFRRPCVGLLCASLALWGHRVASAQPPSAANADATISESLTGEAKTLYDEGRAAFADERYQEALDRFTRAIVLSDDPRLMWNAAACERKLGHNVRALAYLDAYLNEADVRLSEAERSEAKKAVTAVRAYVGEARIETDPPGADVVVDGQRAGVTPIGSLLLDAGTRRLRFTKEGYLDLDRAEEVAPGSAVSWRFQLQKRPTATRVRGRRNVAEPDAPRADSPPTGPIVTVALGGALGVTGAVFLGVSAAKYGSLRNECGTACEPSQWKPFRALETSSIALLAVGGAAIGGGATWWIVSARAEGPRKAWLRPMGAGIAGGMHFR